MITRVIVRDRARLAMLAAALVILAASVVIVPAYSARAGGEVAAKLVDAANPPYVAVLAPLNASEEALLEAWERLSSVEPGEPVRGVAGLLLVHVAWYYEAGEPWGMACAEPSPVAADYVYVNESLCVAFSPVYAALPLGGSLSDAGILIARGEAPRGPGEAAVFVPLAEALGVDVGDTLSLGPLELRVSGLYWLRGVYGGAYDRPFIVVSGDIGLDDLAEAVGEWRESYRGPGLEAFLERDFSGAGLRPGDRGLAPGLAGLEWGPEGGDVGVPFYSPALAPVKLVVAYSLDGRALLGYGDPDKAVSAARAAVAEHLAESGVLPRDAVDTLFPEGEGVIGYFGSVDHYDGFEVSVAGDEDGVAGALAPQFSLASMIATVSAVLLAAAAAFRVSRDTLATIIGDMRGVIALLVARGADKGLVTRGFTLAAAPLAMGGALAGLAVGFASGTGLPGWLLAAAAAAGAALGVGYTMVRARRLVGEVEAWEAVRRRESIVREYARPRPSRRDLLLLGASLIALAIGLYGDLEAIMEAAANYGGAIAALVVTTVMIGFVFAPFAPVVLARTAADAASGSARLHSLAARASARLAGRLAWAAARSAERLAARLKASVAAPALALGAALGAAVAGETLAYYSREAALKPFSVDAVGFAAGLEAAASSLAAAAWLAAAAGVAASLVASHAAVRIIEAESVIARARGASASEASRLAAATVAPALVHAVAAGLGVAAVTYGSLVAAARMAQVEAGATGLVGLAPHPGLASLGVGLAMAASVAAPVVLAWLRVGRGPLVERLRRMGW